MLPFELCSNRLAVVQTRLLFETRNSTSMQSVISLCINFELRGPITFLEHTFQITSRTRIFEIKILISRTAARSCTNLSGGTLIDGAPPASSFGQLSLRSTIGLDVFQFRFLFVVRLSGDQASVCLYVGLCVIWLANELARTQPELFLVNQ